MRMWATCKPQKTSPTRTHGGRLFQVERWQHTKALLCRSSRDSQEDREFYQAKTVKTHSNNLVVFAHVQLKPFYRLFTRDVTHVRKCTRPSPALPNCKRRKAGQGLGMRLVTTCDCFFFIWYMCVQWSPSNADTTGTSPTMT